MIGTLSDPSDEKSQLQPLRPHNSALLNRRRTIARMIRVELEIILELLNQALKSKHSTPSST